MMIAATYPPFGPACDEPTFVDRRGVLTVADAGHRRVAGEARHRPRLPSGRRYSSRRRYGSAVPELITIIADDGVVLEGELTMALTPRFGLVLCHPASVARRHDALDRHRGALPRASPKYNVAALRFNFRGVGNSDGEHDGGPAEQLDADRGRQAARGRSCRPARRSCSQVGRSAPRSRSASSIRRSPRGSGSRRRCDSPTSTAWRATRARSWCCSPSTTRSGPPPKWPTRPITWPQHDRRDRARREPLLRGSHRLAGPQRRRVPRRPAGAGQSGRAQRVASGAKPWRSRNTPRRSTTERHCARSCS